MLGNILNALLQSQQQGQQGTGADTLSQAVGGALGGQQGGGTPVSQLLGGLEQILGGKPGSNQTTSQNTAAASSSPLMSLLGPIANAVAGQVGISPSIATTVAATALHYLASSHPASGTSAPLNLGNVAQQMASGSVSQETLHSSGMVNAVAQATGLSQAQAAASLNSTFNYMQQHAAEHKAKEEHRKKRREG
jgi:hypothetical protein